MLASMAPPCPALYRAVPTAALALNVLPEMASRSQSIAPPSVGQEAAIGGHLATLSYRNNKKVLWDAKTNKYKFV